MEYNARALLNSATGGQALSITSEAFFDFLDNFSEGNQGYGRDISRTTTQKFAWILDVDKATTLNAKIDAMQHSMPLQFKKLALIKAPVNVVQQKEKWCGVCGSETHDTDQCEANPTSVNYVVNVQRGQANKIMVIVITQIG